MADDQNHEETAKPVEPRGFGEHSRGLAGEYAHELGWGLEEEQRTTLSKGPQPSDGGTDYEYGARDFGDEPVNTAPSSTPSSDGPDIANNPAVPEKESMKHHGDPLEPNEEPATPETDALPAAEDNTHPHSPVAP